MKLTKEYLLEQVKKIHSGEIDNRDDGMVVLPFQLVINVIDRLRGDNEAILKDYYAEKQTCAEQKSEIERLTGERERVAWQKQEYLDWVHGLLSTHTEMKDRGEDYKMFDRDWLCDILWLKIEPFYATIFDLERQRNELQKQVDESTDICFDCPYKLKFEEIEKQAVKDTAKEILTKFADDFKVVGMDVEYPLNRVKIYAKQFGVEVE